MAARSSVEVNSVLENYLSSVFHIEENTDFNAGQILFDDKKSHFLYASRLLVLLREMIRN
jgi:hypothetical protein